MIGDWLFEASVDFKSCVQALISVQLVYPCKWFSCFKLFNLQSVGLSL